MKKHKFKIGIGISKGNFYRLCDPKHIFIQATQFQTFTQTAKIIRRPQLEKILSYGRQIKLLTVHNYKKNGVMDGK